MIGRTTATHLSVAAEVPKGCAELFIHALLTSPSYEPFSAVCETVHNDLAEHV